VKLYNPYSGLRGLPPAVWVVFATTLVNRAGMMALPFLVLYLTQHLHITAARAGLAVATYGVGGFLVAPWAGRLSDRVGPFAVMRASLAATGIVLFVIPLIDAYAALLCATFVWGVAADAARPATMSALTGSVAPEQRQAAIAVNRLAINIGASIGPAAGGFLAMISFPLLFTVDAISTIAAALLLSVMIQRYPQIVETLESKLHEVEDPGANVGGAAPVLTRSASVWRDPRALALIAAAFLVNFVYSQDIGALPVHIVGNLHYPESFFGSLFLLNTLIILAIEVPLNLAMAKGPAWRGSALAALLIAAGYGALAFAHAPVAIAFTVVLWTFGEMMFFPGTITSMAELAGPRNTGAYMGALSAAFSLAVVVGPWAGTVMLDRAGPVHTWTALFAVGVAAAGLLALTRPRRPAPSPRAAP
jgi:predicted MFS family arabinose efflux permease